MDTAESPNPTTAGIRRLMNKVFSTTADFDAFVIDAFQDTHLEKCQRILSVADHVERVTLLLILFGDELNLVIDELMRLQPERTARYRHLLHATSMVSTGANMDSAMVARLLGYGEPLLKCDRENPWHDFHQFVESPGHGLVLLPGAAGEAHVFFLIRVEKSVARLKTPCRVVWMSWLRRGQPPFPTSQAEAYSRIATALRAGSAKELGSYLSTQLAEHNLIFLNDPPINRGYSDEAIESCWQMWIPELIAPLKSRYFCKFIQPVSWARSSGTRQRLQARIARTFQPGLLTAAHEEALSQELAHALMARLKKKCSRTLPVLQTRDLSPIKRPDVINFLTLTGYAADLPTAKAEQERAWLADRVLLGDPTSEEILRALCRELPDLSD